MNPVRPLSKRAMTNLPVRGLQPQYEASMILPLINEMPGFGFAEELVSDDGRLRRVGVVQLTPANAQRLQDLLHRGAPLVYSGPVWAHDHWCAETFPVMPSNAHPVREQSTTFQFRERD